MLTDYYTITTPAATYPVTLTDVKAWLNILHTSDDTLLTALITTATEKAEKITNRAFITRTITGYFSGLQCSPYEVGYYLSVRRAPVASLTSVKVFVDDVETTIDSGDYNLKHTGGFPRIVFEELDYAPDLIPYPYRVYFTAGYGLATAVPDAIKTAIKESIAYWYQNRGDCGGEMELPKIAMGILREYRIVDTFGA